MISLLTAPISLALAAPDGRTQSRSATAPTSQKIEQYGQVGRRFGLTPQQVDEVYAFIKINGAEITRIAATNKVNVVAFQAIAKELGLRNYGVAPPKLIEAIRLRGADAAKFERENAALKIKVASLTSSAEKDSAEKELARAESAYASGDVEGAQRHLTALLALRWVQSSEAQTTYLAALSSAIELARSRGDLQTLDFLVTDSDTVLARREASARFERWRNSLTLAQAYYEQGDLRGENPPLLKAIKAYREKALPLVDRGSFSGGWAFTQLMLAKALLALGERERGTAHLDEAITATNRALEVYNPDRTPGEWASAQGLLASMLLRLGEREVGTARLEASVAARKSALSVVPRATDPQTWASLQIGLGASLLSLSGREQGSAHLREQGSAHLTEAIEAFRLAIATISRVDQPQGWSSAQVNIGTALASLAARNGDPKIFGEAVDAFDQALQVTTRDKLPLQWATIQMNRSAALEGLAGVEQGIGRFEQAASGFRSALEERRRDRVPLDWANAQLHLADVTASIADRSGDPNRLAEASALLAEAIPVVQDAHADPLFAWTEQLRQRFAAIAAKHGWR